MDRLSFDTTFLIDLQREASKKSHGAEGTVFRESEFCFSVTVLGEYAAGFEDLVDPHFNHIVRHFRLLQMDRIVALHYREIFRCMKREGALIGANDLCIAATALRYDLPLVTRNGNEFERVRGLSVLEY